MARSTALRQRSRSNREAPRLSTATWLTLLVAAMCGVGVIVVFSASSVISMSLYGNAFSIGMKEVIWMLLGAICFIITSRTDYNQWRRFAVLGLVGTMGLLVMVLVPGLGVTSGGSSRWIGISWIRIQPSELMKLALAIFGADLIARRQQEGCTNRQLIGPLAIVAGTAAALVIKQPDLGTAMVLMVITITLLFAAGIPGVLLAKGIGVVTALVTIAAFAMPYRRERLLSFVDPGSKADGSGYQVVQSLIGLGSGHLFGLGLGGSREKWGLLPNAHTDFIFSIIGEELGLIAVLGVLVLLGVFVFKGLRSADLSSDRFGALLGVSLVTWIASEALINIGAVIGVLPVTGIPLPFISFGGSSLVITMAAAGMLVSIARRGTEGTLAPAKAPRRAAKKATGRKSPVRKTPARSSTSSKAHTRTPATARSAAPRARASGTTPHASRRRATTAARGPASPFRQPRPK